MTHRKSQKFTSFSKILEEKSKKEHSIDFYKVRNNWFDRARHEAILCFCVFYIFFEVVLIQSYSEVTQFVSDLYNMQLFTPFLNVQKI